MPLNTAKTCSVFPIRRAFRRAPGCNGLVKKGAYLTENILDIFSAFGLDFTAQNTAPLTERERQVLDAVISLGEAHISQIASSLSCQTFELLAELSSLEVKGLVARLGGNRYAATN